MTLEQVEQRVTALKQHQEYARREAREVLGIWEAVQECPDLNPPNFPVWLADQTGMSEVTVWRRLKQGRAELAETA